MLYEYAVEPQAIGGSWETFRYVIEKFGFDRGRLIAQFPRSWFEDVYAAARTLPPGQKKRVEVALAMAQRDKVVQSSRAYDSSAGDWLRNALRQQPRTPFHAIIAKENPGGQDYVLPVDDLDELHPLLVAPRDIKMQRDASSLTQAMSLMLRYGAQILFVDAYYDPFSPRYQSTFRECLKVVKSLNPTASCDIHHLDRDGQPSAADFEREAKRLFQHVIPSGRTVTIYRWREKVGGEDFHARYLLTNKGGMRVEAGFSAEGSHQTTDMSLLDFDFSQAARHSLSRGANVYDLVEPVLQIAPNGYVEHI
jgi:hypothetical protein